MSWLSLVPVVLVTVAVAVLPGFAVALALRLRGMLLWAAAAPISATIVGTASVWSQLIGLRWSLLPIAVTTIVVLVLAIPVRLIWRSRFSKVGVAPEPTAGPTRRVPLQMVALIGAGAIILIQLLVVLGSPGSISQTFDNVFHLNAVRFILDTGSASPLTIGTMTSVSGGVPFYPDVWHAVVAVIVESTSVTIPEATNALIIVVAAIVWPASVAALTRTLIPVTRAVTVSAAVIATACAAFPLLMIDYGVLYPYFYAVALLPCVIALTLRLLSLGVARSERTLQLVLALAATVPGLLLTHPGAFVAWLVASGLLAVWRVFLFARSGPPRKRLMLVLVLLVAYAAVAIVAWRVLRPPYAARGWPTEQSLPQALGEVAFLGMNRSSLSPLLVGLMWIGIVVLWRSKTTPARVAVTLFLLYGTLYVVSSALPWPHLRDLFTAAWYNNAPRLAALLPMMVVPLAAAGAAHVFGRLRRALQRAAVTEPTTGGIWRDRAVVVSGITVLVVALPFFGVSNEVRSAQSIYTLSNGSPLLSSDEYELLKRLPKEVPEDAVIAGSPWTGTALAYAISGRNVVMRHILTDISDDGTVVNEKLNQANSDPAVCPAVRNSNVRFVLDFGQREVHGAHHDYPGLDSLAQSGVATLVDQVGDARLFKITSCGLGQ